MNTPASPTEFITLNQLTHALTAADIDHMVRKDDRIYVTGLEFPTFWTIDDERELLMFSTYLDVADTAKDDALLAFVNACNREYILIQFSYHADVRRFYGYHPLTIALNRDLNQIIETGRLFASIFQTAASEGIDAGLLVPLN